MAHPKPQPDQQPQDQLRCLIQERNTCARQLGESLGRYIEQSPQGHFVLLYKPEDVKSYEAELKTKLKQLDTQIDELTNRRYA
jgi:hypothetical protein